MSKLTQQVWNGTFQGLDLEKPLLGEDSLWGWFSLLVKCQRNLGVSHGSAGHGFVGLVSWPVGQ